MTLIEGRETLEPRIIGNRSIEADSAPFDESGSDDEFLIANEGYPEDGENNNNRDYFSLPALPTLGLNYLNNLNLSLNLNLNLRNSSLWRIYENTTFTKPAFFSSYLGKHTDDELDLHAHEITPESGGYFTITNFLRRHGFQSYEEDYSEEAVLERVRFKKLQQAAAAAQKTQQLISHNFISSDFDTDEAIKARHVSGDTPLYEELVEETFPRSESKIQDIEDEGDNQPTEEKSCTDDIQQKDMQINSNVSPCVNPFYNRVEVSTWDGIKIGIFSLPLLAIKFSLIFPILALALILSLIGMYGITFEETQSRPLPKWRRAIRWIIANVVMRAFVFCSGFFWHIEETGKRATPEEAPIFVVGPHSSYFDAFVVILLGAPSVVAKLSTKDIAVFGRLVTFTQAVYVSRESKGSRKQTMEVLKQRAQDVYNGSGMPQIFIFPEGTCSNRSSLIKFKAGAFVPQVPVQPVLIRYPNAFDTVTWTFDGPEVWKSILYAYSQFYIKVEIEYLPVYVPNEEEKNDPGLFADNVRQVMAEALDVPVSDFQYEDGALLCTMRESLVQKFRSIHRAKKALGLSGSAHEAAMIHRCSRGEINYNWEFQQFQREFFHVTSEDTTVPEVLAAFNNFKKDDENTVDIRQYLLLTSILYEDFARTQDLSTPILQLYNLNPDEVTEAELKQLLEHVFESTHKNMILPPAPHIRTYNEPITSEKIVTEGDDENNALVGSENLRQRTSRHLDFAKLFADEVTERLPKTYPRRDQRDKLPKRKQKTD